MHWINPRLGHFRAASLDSLEQQREDILAKPAYGVFRTADKKLLCIAALEDHFWSRLNNVLELQLSCEAYDTHAGRVADAALINSRIAKRAATFPAGELLALLAAADVPVSPVVEPAALHEVEHSMSRRLFSGEGSPGFVRYPVPMAGVGSRR